MGNMTTEIFAFLLTISGWILISSTLPTDYWKVSSVDGTVITTATFWSNLWKTCVTDSTGVSNCKDFPSMLALDGILFLSSNICWLFIYFLSKWSECVCVCVFMKIADRLLVLFPSSRECRCLIVRKRVAWCWIALMLFWQKLPQHNQTEAKPITWLFKQRVYCAKTALNACWHQFKNATKNQVSI